MAPILSGLDKLTHVLVDWDKNLAPEFADVFNAQSHTLLCFVEGIEIVAGLAVLARPGLAGTRWWPG